MDGASRRRVVRVVAVVAVALALAIAARGLVRLNTWYLASDQFAFLTLAEDLREGRLTRTDSFYDFMPRNEKRAYDAYAQTYRLREGALHSRYPPGFSALLAMAALLFGEAGEHWLNPFLYLVVLVVLARLVFVVLEPSDELVAFGAAAAVPWLLLLLPTDVHLWGITVARDLPAHLLGLLALLASVRGRELGAGVALGLACVVRPDAALWAASIGAVALVRQRVAGSLGWGALGFALGAAPLFAYNWATLGSPLSFTQGSEFLYFLSAVSPLASVAHAAPPGFVAPAGGGFRLAHLAGTLRGNLAILGGSFGWFAIAMAVGTGFGAARCRLLVAAFLPYAAIATVFYGFWSHPDPRYLAGVSLCLLPLVAAGLAAAGRRIADPDAPWWWRAGAIAVLAAAIAVRLVDPESALLPARVAWGAIVLMAALGLFALRTRVSDAVRFLAPTAPAVLLLVLALVAVASGPGRRDPYSREQIGRARRVFESVVPAGSVVVTSPALGRPAENLTHYTGARGVYASELAMLGTTPGRVATYHLVKGRRVFLLLPPVAPGVVEGLPGYLEVREVRRIPPGEAYDWFLNPRRAHGGAVLHEVAFAASAGDLVEKLRRSDGRGDP